MTRNVGFQALGVANESPRIAASFVDLACVGRIGCVMEQWLGTSTPEPLPYGQVLGNLGMRKSNGWGVLKKGGVFVTFDGVRPHMG